MSSYHDEHRAFLQAFFARQSLNFEDARSILAKIQTISAGPDGRPTLPGDISQEDFDQYVDIINDSISPFDFEIRSSLHQVTKDRVYALVNVTSDPLTQWATTHSAEELGFIRRLLDAMFETYNSLDAEIMAVTSMQALKLARVSPGQTQTQRTESVGGGKLNGISGPEAESVLDKLIDEGWLERNEKSGYYTLTPRALMELRGMLVDTYNEPENDGDDDDDDDDQGAPKIKFCHACKDIVTVGQRCSDVQCLARIHYHCVNNVWRAQGNNQVCPLCEKDWAHARPVGEKAAATRRGAKVASTVDRQRSTQGQHSDGVNMVESEDDSDSVTE